MAALSFSSHSLNRLKLIMSLQKNYLLRRIALPLLKLFNRDIEIDHPWTRGKIKLALFEHKGYWFYGKAREFNSMLAFDCLLFPGARVIEVGGHIGYISLYFAEIVGGSGEVVVFEPATNNLNYIRSNIIDVANIKLEEAGCSDRDGQSILYMDNLTGQNNSLVYGFKGLAANANAAKGVRLETKSLTITTIKIDTFCEKNAFHPDFIKIDVEGHELAVLNGTLNLLNSGHPPMLMVEIQTDHHDMVNLLRRYGYLLFFDNGEQVSESFDFGIRNVFALHPDYHRIQMDSWLRGLDGKFITT